jgi:Shikimate kinase
MGMPGCGKTYWGRRWALRSGCMFIDLDEKIETNLHLTIPSIINQFGESYFRKVESNLLQKVIDETNEHVAIVATGGGTPCFFDNMKMMKKTGKTIFIDQPLEVLFNRIANDATKRPLINMAHMEKNIENLYNTRIYFYQQADITLLGNQIDETTFDKMIAT